MNNLGFIQGRLSPIVNNQIQAFPWQYWKEEFGIASELELKLIEWTLDHEDIRKNPFLLNDQQQVILELLDKYSMTIPSLTGDCFMQKPFYKEKNESERLQLVEILKDIIKSCGILKTRYIVLPLVDNGSLENTEQEKILEDTLFSLVELLESNVVKIIFESDLPPDKLALFIEKYSSEYFGINYDSGNSASLGYDISEEFKSYSDRIDNIHIKDRLLGGTTVPLGKGNCNFEELFNNVKKYNYRGNLILQTARANDGDHRRALVKYKNFVEGYL